MSSNSINYSVYIAQKAKRAFSGKLKKIFKDTKFGHDFWGKIGKNTPKKWFLQYYDFSRDPGMSIPGNGNSKNHVFPGNPGTGILGSKHYFAQKPNVSTSFILCFELASFATKRG